MDVEAPGEQRQDLSCSSISPPCTITGDVSNEQSNEGKDEWAALLTMFWDSKLKNLVFSSEKKIISLKIHCLTKAHHIFVCCKPGCTTVYVSTLSPGIDLKDHVSICVALNSRLHCRAPHHINFCVWGTCLPSPSPQSCYPGLSPYPYSQEDV